MAARGPRIRWLISGAMAAGAGSALSWVSLTIVVEVMESMRVLLAGPIPLDADIADTGTMVIFYFLPGIVLALLIFNGLAGRWGSPGRSNGECRCRKCRYHSAGHHEAALLRMRGTNLKG